jgi:putative ABC transport system permease protein
VSVLALLVAPILAITIHDVVRRPSFRRLAFRNVVRRKNEAALVVLGSLLGTAIITSSFVVGDTFDASIRDLARTQYGPIDESIAVSDPARLASVEQLVREPPVPGTDGALGVVSASATAASDASTGTPRAEPRALVHEVDFDRAREFGGDPGSTGLADAGSTPAPGEAVIGGDLADELEIGPGDALALHLFGQRLDVVVRGVVPRLGIAGFYPQEGGESPVVFVAPGTLAPIAATGVQPGADPPLARVLVSNEGGVFDGVDATGSVVPQLERRLGAVEGTDVATVKQDILDEAEDVGRELGQLFTTIGGFSVAAGVLLLVNIFVMLAEERKTELGMLRAVGLKRNHLVRSFGLEGNIYSLAASVVGALAGVAVGRAVVLAAFAIFQDDEMALPARFAVEGSSLVSGMLIGLTICLVTVWGTSLRIGRLNVIRAIRDLPEPPATGARLRTLVAASIGVVVGGLLTASGIAASSGVPALLGPAVAAWSAVPLLSRVLSRRAAVTVPCLAALLWAVFAFSIVPRVFENSDVPVFLVQGLVLVASAVALVVVNDDLFRSLTDRLSGSGRGLAARLGLANPLAKRFRTGLLLGMYALVVFVLVFLATFADILAAQAPRFTREVSAGHDLLVESTPGNPASEEQLEAHDEVAGAIVLVRGFPKFSAPELTDEPDYWPMTGYDESFVEGVTPALESRGSQFGSDREVWEAVLADESLAVVPDFFLQGGGPPEGQLDPGDTFTVINPVGGAERTLTVAGVVEGDWMFNGVMASADVVRASAERVSANRAYVDVVDGADPERVAAELDGALVTHGVDAETFRSIVDTALAEQNSFFSLMQGFLALGLVIGIAGLGVVMVRAVRERRREIGMLRAMGFPARVVRAAFIIEATFIALQGIVIGVVLGLVTGWSVLSSSQTFGDEPLPFSVPWGALVVLPVVALGASLLAVAAPAAQASRIKPAVALRIAD